MPPRRARGGGLYRRVAEGQYHSFNAVTPFRPKVVHYLGLNCRIRGKLMRLKSLVSGENLYTVLLKGVVRHCSSFAVNRSLCCPISMSSAAKKESRGAGIGGENDSRRQWDQQDLTASGETSAPLVSSFAEYRAPRRRCRLCQTPGIARLVGRTGAGQVHALAS